MTTLIAILQIAIIGLCVWGELNRNLKRSSLMSSALAIIAISALIGLAKGHADALAVLLWLGLLIALIAILHRRSRRHRHHIGDSA